MTTNDRFSGAVAKELVRFGRLSTNEILAIVQAEAKALNIKQPRAFASKRLVRVQRALKEHGAKLEKDGSVTL